MAPPEDSDNGTQHTDPFDDVSQVIVRRWSGAFKGIIIALVTAIITGSGGFLLSEGARSATTKSQAGDIARHETAITRIEADKASKADVQKQIDTWTAAQTKVLDEVKTANTDQHKAINTQLEGISKLLWEMKRSK